MYVCIRAAGRTDARAPCLAGLVTPFPTHPKVNCLGSWAAHGAKKKRVGFASGLCRKVFYIRLDVKVRKSGYPKRMHCTAVLKRLRLRRPLVPARGEQPLTRGRCACSTATGPVLAARACASSPHAHATYTSRTGYTASATARL